MNYDYSMQVFSTATENVTDWYRQREMTKEKCLLEELKALDKICPYPLRWRKKNGKCFFWERVNGKQQGISSDLSRVYALARHDFLSLRRQISHQESVDSCHEKLKSLLQSFEDAGLDIRRVILTPKQYAWARNPQSQNSKHTEALQYKTNGGVLVRSKSEQIIGNMLEEFCIPYRYEPALTIDHRVFHPDFVIMTTDGRLIILEHLGRMDLDSYVASNIERLRAYNNDNLMIGRDVFLSFESDIRNRDRILAIINRIMAS